VVAGHADSRRDLAGLSPSYARLTDANLARLSDVAEEDHRYFTPPDGRPGTGIVESQSFSHRAALPFIYWMAR